MDKISISILTSSYETDKCVSIKIEDENYNIIYKGEMTADMFGKCIAGLSACDIERIFKERGQQ